MSEQQECVQLSLTKASSPDRLPPALNQIPKRSRTCSEGRRRPNLSLTAEFLRAAAAHLLGAVSTAHLSVTVSCFGSWTLPTGKNDAHNVVLVGRQSHYFTSQQHGSKLFRRSERPSSQQSTGQWFQLFARLFASCLREGRIRWEEEDATAARYKANVRYCTRITVLKVHASSEDSNYNHKASFCRGGYVRCPAGPQ